MAKCVEARALLVRWLDVQEIWKQLEAPPTRVLALSLMYRIRYSCALGADVGVSHCEATTVAPFDVVGGRRATPDAFLCVYTCVPLYRRVSVITMSKEPPPLLLLVFCCL